MQVRDNLSGICNKLRNVVIKVCDYEVEEISSSQLVYRYYVQGYYPQQFDDIEEGKRAIEMIKVFRLHDKDDIEVTYDQGYYGMKIKNTDYVYLYAFESKIGIDIMIASMMSNEPIEVVSIDEHVYILAQTENEYFTKEFALRDLPYVRGLGFCDVEERAILR
jgi:hypothetical protein